MNRNALGPVAVTILVVFSFVFALSSPAAPSRAVERPVADAQLGRALVEARANVEAARALGAGTPRVLLRTEELELALRACPELSKDPEEHVRLLLVSRLIRDLARAIARGEGARRLADERLTEEDFRFLLAAMEARLARAANLEAKSRPESYDRAALRQFRGLGFEGAIRSLFE